MFKKIGFSLLLILAIALANVGAAFADNGVTPVLPLVSAPTAETGAFVDETPALWFVELNSNPTADGTRLATVLNERSLFRTQATRAGLVYTERFAYSNLFNGLSIEIAPSQLSVLARIPGVKAIYPVEVVTLPEPAESINPDLFTALAMTGADITQSELGFTGAGIKVAVMDTGIDVDHPAFGGDGVARNDSPLFPSARVAYGYDFVGDAFNADSTAASYNPIPSPDPNPDDCAGHGTHVAGIIGANDATTGLKGVAPDVTFGAYRVFGCEGSTTADIMIAAMEMVLADGMQVLNMSIGSSFQWPQYPTAMAADRLVAKGVVVVASIGNSGANGLYSAGAPGVGRYTIGVASFDNTDVFLPYFTVNGQHIGYVSMTYAGPAPTSGTGEIEDVGLACDPLAVDLTGKVALAARGTCSFGTKATNAINAGAEAVLISNNVSGVFNGTLGAPIDGVTPVVGISLADGIYIRAQAAPIMMEWTDQQDSFPSPTGGLISSFSSYGLAPDLSFKPDLGAPGGNIYSSYPLELGGYATLSGTSMASPHVAGAAALFLQAHPNTKSGMMKTYLQNSADPAPWWGNPGLGYLDNVNRQGAGMIDIDDAILATNKIEPSSIAAGESEFGSIQRVLQITNKGAGEDVIYDVSYVNALSNGANTFTPSFYGSDATVTFSADTITVQRKNPYFLTVTINPPTGPVGGQYGGYIVFTPQDGGQVLRVPFAGFIGDYQDKVVLEPTAYGFPWVAISYMGSFYGPVTGPDDWTFTMVGEDVPNFLIHLDHQSRYLRVRIYSEKGKSYFYAYYEEYLPRNSTSTGFFAFPFDGNTFLGSNTYTVPDGNYYAVISVLKANGDINNPDHWETWTSPIFTIDRP